VQDAATGEKAGELTGFAINARRCVGLDFRASPFGRQLLTFQL